MIHQSPLFFKHTIIKKDYITIGSTVRILNIIKGNCTNYGKIDQLLHWGYVLTFLKQHELKLDAIITKMVTATATDIISLKLGPTEVHTDK